MKTLTSLMLVFFLAACASSPWDGMDYHEADQWRSIGASAHEAHQLRKQAFSPYDSKPWFQAGIRDSRTIVAWHRSKFSALEARDWMKGGFNLEEAIHNRSKGLTVAK